MALIFVSLIEKSSQEWKKNICYMEWWWGEVLCSLIPTFNCHNFLPDEILGMRLSVNN